MFKRREERTDPSEILAPMATRDLVRRLSSSLLTRAIHSPSYHITDGGRSLSLVRNAARPHTRQFFSPSLGGGWTSTSSLPASAAEQQLYVKELMRRGQHEAVVALWEGGRLAAPEGVFAEYVTALARLERLDSTALMETLRRGYLSSVGGSAAGSAAGSTSGFMGMAAAQLARSGSQAGADAAASPLGSSANPVYMMQAEPTFASQMWRSVRILGLAFLLMAGVGAMAEERGLSKGIMNNPDVQPQMDTSTKFADVKGVDEAKGELEEIVLFCDVRRVSLQLEKNKRRTGSARVGQKTCM